MGDLDVETIDWLNTLKLGNKLNYLSDFENGYYMGLIFERMNLSKGRKFKNTNDMACKFQNFKNIKDLLYENFRVDFPIQNILFNTEALLLTIRDSIKKYNRQKKEATLRRIQTFSVGAKIQPNQEKMFASRRKDILSSSKMNQTTKFPKKIQEIQQKLEKYKEIKVKHEIMALQDRKRQIEDNRRMIEEHRLYELNKVRTNHQFMKEHERKVFDVWMKTEQIKQARVEKDNNLKSFLQEKKNKFHQSLRDEQVNSFKEGLQAFQMNCIRQGIELEHDPDRQLAKTEQNFNKQVVMERIKDNIKIHQKERKDRIKRQNKKRVDAKEANDKAEVIWTQNNLVEDYAKKMQGQLQFCNAAEKTRNRQAAEREIIKRKAKNKSYTELPKPLMTEEERQQEYRIREMEYRQHHIERLQRRDKKHRIIAQNALEALIHIIISNQDEYYTNKGFTYSEWKKIEQEYLKYEKKEKRTKASSRYIDQSYEGNARQYIEEVGQWSRKEQNKTDFKLSNVLSDVIEKAYPPKEVPAKGDVPLHMPLKIGFVGSKLSGKSSIANKIAAKYDVPILDPKAILKEAIDLNKEPIIEDPKKKKDSKKPEEQNPQKIALKQFGQRMMKKMTDLDNTSIDDYIEVIQFSLKRSHIKKNQEGVLYEFRQAKEKETERYNKAVKDYQDAQKKKKDKKAQAQQPPSERKYFYTKGFILEGLQLSEQNLKKLELKLNNHISFEERINAEGEELKQTISSIIPVPKAVKDTTLQRGTFDLLIQLDATKQTLEERQPAEKIQIDEVNFNGIKNYYSDFGNQRTKFNAYQVLENNGTIDECIETVSKLIELHLDQKYQEIKHYQPVEKIEQKVQEPQTKQKEQQKQPVVQQQPQQGDKIEEQGKKPTEPVIEIKQTPEKMELSQEKSRKLVNNFGKVFQKYLRNIIQAFTDYDQLRNEFGVHLIATEQQFVSIINRPDDKASKVLTFQQNYNKLLSEKTNIVKDAEASKHLISKLDQLNDNLWSVIEMKKNQAVQQRQKVVASSSLNTHIEKIVEVTKAMFQNELNLLVQIIFFIYNYNNALKGKDEDILAQYLVLGIPPQIEPVMSFESDEFKSARMEYYINQVQECLKELPNWLKKKEKKLKIQKFPSIETILVDFIEKQVSKLQRRLQQISQKTKQLYLQYYCFFRVLTNKMDDWIIEGIKHENQFIYDIYKAIKKNIIEAKRSGVKDLFVKDITDIIHPISNLPQKRLPIVEETQVNHFKIMSFAIFMQEIKCLATAGKIPFKVFKSYLQKRRKSKWLHPEFLQLELDIMQQYLVTDQFCNYHEVSLAILLWNITILDEDSILEYQKNLADNTDQNSQNENYQYLKEELSFEEFKLMPGITKDPEQQRIIKTFVFQIFKEDHRDKLIVKDYIDTLILFSQLQVFRYGDTLMILHEAGDKHHYQNA